MKNDKDNALEKYLDPTEYIFLKLLVPKDNLNANINMSKFNLQDSWPLCYLFALQRDRERPIMKNYTKKVFLHSLANWTLQHHIRRFIKTFYNL